jgi:hypothetical protein
VTLAHGSSRASIAAENRLPGVVNYFNGPDSKNWHTGLATFERLRYKNVYPGIDLIYYGNQGQLEFDFELAPGADFKSIRIHFEGADNIRLDRNGNLVVTGKGGEVSFKKPLIYQLSERDEREFVAGTFQPAGRNTVAFAISGYDHARPLVIDPILNYSTYIGPLAEGTSIAVDQNGEAFVTGLATLDFPTTAGSYQPVGTPSSSAGNIWPEVGKPFVAKFNSQGTALLYSTFLSGSGIDAAYGLALDASGEAFVVGTTSSTDFPITTGALQKANVASQTTGFVTKLNSSGSALVYSTYIGGSASTTIEKVAVDAAGDAYLTGSTLDTNFPVTAGAYMTAAPIKAAGGSGSAFVAKLNPAGTAFGYSTYLGGNEWDAAFALAVDSAGEAFVGGVTTSNNFPVTAGVIQGSRQAGNQQAGFVTKLNSPGSALVYSTYLAGGLTDSVNAIALDSGGNAYAAGSTNSSNFPVTPGAFQSRIGIDYFGDSQTNAFVSEFNSDATALNYSTFLGGGISAGVDANEGDAANTIALDQHGLVYLSGSACTADFPITPGAFELENLDGEYSGQCSAFLTIMNPVPQTPLIYSTYFGGTGNQNPPSDGPTNGDDIISLALDPSGNVYLTGFTYSVDFPTTAGVIETSFEGPSEEALVAEFNASELKALPVPTVVLTSNTSSTQFGQPITFTATVHPASGNTPPTGYVGFNFLQQELSDTGPVGSGVGFGAWTTVPLNGSGVATFTTSSLQALQTPVNASYLGDGNNAPSSGTMTQTITYIPTVTTVTSSANNVPYATPVVFTATVLDNAGKPAPGFVFFAAAGVYGQLNAAGQATWTNGVGASPLPVGTDSVKVVFSPDIGYQSSSGTISETFTALGVLPAPTFSPPPGTYTSAQQVVLADAISTAGVYYTIDGSTPVPGISPQFLNGLPIMINSSETINAIAGLPGYSPSNVVSAPYIINLPPPDFSISLASPVMYVSAGASDATIVTINVVSGFAQSVSFSCSGLPANVTCAFSPAAVNGYATSTLTVTASTAAKADARTAELPLAPVAAIGAMLGCIGLRRRRIWLFALLVCTLSLGSLVACGGGNSPPASTATSSANFAVSVIGTSGSLSHSASLSLTVTQ